MATLAEALTSTFLPSTCAMCSAALPWNGSRAGVCPECWASVQRHASGCCPRCGDPEASGEGACLACRTSPPPWRAATSVGPYRGALRELVLLLKTRGWDELAGPLGSLLADGARRAGWPRPDAVAAVPMRWLRRVRRGFDQAELLGRAVAGELRAPYVRALRRRAGGAQVGLGRSERLRLSSSSFPARRRVAGRVLLVDDVLTTGATAAACARALAAAGASEVYVLTVARTPQPRRIP